MRATALAQGIKEPTSMLQNIYSRHLAKFHAWQCARRVEHTPELEKTSTPSAVLLSV